MNKLKCFRCNHRFHYFRNDSIWNEEKKQYITKTILHKDQIYHDICNQPVCRDCLYELICDEWSEPDPDQIIDDLSNPKYNFSYKKYMDRLFVLDCPSCGVGIYIDKDHSTGEQTCWDCGCFFFTKEGVVTGFWEDEDAYIEQKELKESI